MRIDWKPLLLIIFLGCKKDNENIVLAPSNQPPVTPSVTSSFLIPKTPGSWWKFNRTDTIVGYNYGIPDPAIIKKSEELMSVIGPVTLNNGMQAIAYKIENLTYQNLDTLFIETGVNYMRFTSASIHTQYNRDPQGFYFPLPVVTNRSYPYAHPYVVTDTFISPNSIKYNSAVYFWQHAEWFSSAYTETDDKYYFLKDSVGILQTYYKYKAPNGSRTTIFKTLTDKKINP